MYIIQYMYTVYMYMHVQYTCIYNIYMYMYVHIYVHYYMHVIVIYDALKES